jgi:hypothetical protein
MAYLNLKCRAALRTLVQHTSNAYSRLSTYDYSAFQPQQEIPKKQQFDISPPQVSNDFSQVSTDSPHSSHPNLVIRLILDYSDDPEPSPTQFLQQNPLSQIVEEERPSSVHFLVTCL